MRLVLIVALVLLGAAVIVLGIRLGMLLVIRGFAGQI